MWAFALSDKTFSLSMAHISRTLGLNNCFSITDQIAPLPNVVSFFFPNILN
jgi:hypothetical protein